MFDQVDPLPPTHPPPQKHHRVGQTYYYLLGCVPLELRQVLDVVGLRRPLAVVHDGGQLELFLDARHAGWEHRVHGRPVRHRTAATARADAAVLRVEP